MVTKPSSKRKKSENDIPNWMVFSLFFITTLVFVSLIKAYLPLLVTGLAMLFVWSQLTKPVAEIEARVTKDDSNQLNLFHKQYRIGRKYENVKESLDDDDRQRAA